MQRLPNVQLRIAGEGPQRSELEKMWDSLGLANVEFTGQLAGRRIERGDRCARFTVLPTRAYERSEKASLSRSHLAELS